MAFRNPSAFTIIELLVVVGIIALLAGLLFVAGRSFSDAGKKSRTASTLAMIWTATETARAQGISIPTAEHPLAGSAAPRLQFARTDGSAVSTSGEALVGVKLSQLSSVSAKGRLLLPDDRFADPLSPLLYGMERRDCYILGAPFKDVTAYRSLPRNNGLPLDPKANDYGHPDYNNLIHLTKPGWYLDIYKGDVLTNPPAYYQGDVGGTVTSVKKSFDAIFKGNAAFEELSGLGAIGTPVDDTRLLIGGRIWSDQLVNSDRWEPGLVQDTDNRWKSYRLRGMALYDGWGREILVTPDGDGGLKSVRSAGRDGVFRFNPGSHVPGESIYDTKAWDAAPAANTDANRRDRDGSTDNIAN